VGPCGTGFVPFFEVILRFFGKSLHIGIIVVMLPSSVGTYLGIHVECPVFLSDFNHIWIFSMFVDKNLRHQISRKSDQWEPS